MTQQVLILGGSGRIGRSIAQDLLNYTDVTLTLSGRQLTAKFALNPREQYVALDITQTQNPEILGDLIARHDLTIHCAGPFRTRNLAVLAACIQQGKPYLDVADSPDYVRQALSYHAAAQAQGVTCIVGSGIFPGIANSMVRQGIEQFDQAEQVHLSYLVAGSGGAGKTVLRTTFIELQQPFVVKIAGQWQTVRPYSEREVLGFPTPYNGGAGVYWYNTVEAMTLPTSFPQLKTVTTKFGSLPDFYNYLTGWMSRLPHHCLQQSAVIESLAEISYRMTQLTDRWSGIGIVIRLAITGLKGGKQQTYLATLTHADTAAAAGFGCGSIAQQLLANNLAHPGVGPVEVVLPTALFESTLAARGLRTVSTWLPLD